MGTSWQMGAPATILHALPAAHRTLAQVTAGFLGGGGGDLLGTHLPTPPASWQVVPAMQRIVMQGVVSGSLGTHLPTPPASRQVVVAVHFMVMQGVTAGAGRQRMQPSASGWQA